MRLPSVVSVLALAATATTLHAQGPMRVAPSGRATTEVELTFVDSAARAAAQPAKIRIDYGQPHLRGRRLGTDSLVPYDKVWRTGANAPTTLTTDVDLVIGGANVPKGSYILQTIPGRTGWKLMIQRNGAQSQAAPSTAFDPAIDVARVDLRQMTLPLAVESLTFWLIPTLQPAGQTGAPRGELRLAWGTIGLATDWSVR
ncbi:DUF2911 domain-containing protein [Roseisolibacter agri]|uniref:DUF2911 domain-containing protein n=1 Tax=Roseisolibacter agri TaxID=2014610 RepID=A0AA37V6G0_9BACT|nr:DUF2911 domain-containing protein [Roseisolibacter agri]GLC25271.1 hypothetical protein rosag_17840 [Roseisolibacter agri]